MRVLAGGAEEYLLDDLLTIQTILNHEKRLESVERKITS
jgi:hypothetical protein